MHRLTGRSLILLSACALLVAAVRPSPDAARRHLRLLRSTPAADSVLGAAPAAIRLWFSEGVELATTRVRLVGSDDKPVPLGAVSQDKAATDAPVVAPIPGPLASGRYTVNWTTSAKDGHVVKGSFGFTLRAR